MIYKFITICQEIPWELKKVVLTNSLQNVNLLKYYVEFEDVIKLCQPLTTFNVLSRYILPDLEVYSFGHKEKVNVDRFEFTITSSCLREPIRTRSGNLSKYLDFLRACTVNTLEVPGELVFNIQVVLSDPRFNALMALSDIAQRLILKDVASFNTPVFNQFYPKVVEVTMITLVSLEMLRPLVTHLFDTNLSSVKKIRFYIDDDFSKFSALTKLKSPDRQLEVVFRVEGSFFNNSAVKMFLKEDGIKFKLDQLTDPVSSFDYHKYFDPKQKLAQLVITKSKSLKLISKFSPEKIFIETDEIRKFNEGCDSVNEVNLLTIMIRDCNFSRFRNVKEITLISPSIDIASFNSVPDWVEKLSFDSVFKDNGKITFPSNLRKLQLGRNMPFSQLDFTKCDKLETLMFVCSLDIDENHPLWNRLPKSLKDIEFQFRVLPGDRFRGLDSFGMTISDDMEDLTITLRNQRDVLLCINKNDDNDKVYGEIEYNMEFPTCVINNVSREVLISAAKGPVFLLCEKKDETHILTKNSKDLPFKQKSTTKDGFMIFGST
ncbi:unnamed protein product [Ambrosiozyma monospora]|uniref:Unnamed protein product n=1 Tax=Ambrosiozyma monospora TaxID=43982 RepID=A0A9W7DEV6_AMBMO|nr:unnamed protein product [Ambrosiozyma monospora]